MLVLRFKGPDYNSIIRQIFNVGFRFLKQPYTKISKNMKKNIKFFNYLFRKFIKLKNNMSEVSQYFEKQILQFDSSKVKIFFTSDTHWNHTNIIKYCKRPFASVEEMDEALIENWNTIVGPDDIVFHLGDFAWGGSEVWNNVLDRLNGHIYLIIGNHDMKNLRQGYISKFEAVAFQMYIYIDGRAVYLNHYPFLCYGGSYRGEQAVWQLFGHVHSQPQHYNIDDINDPEVKEILGKDAYRLQYLMPTQYDVGVDNNNYLPISWEEVKEKIQKQIEAYKDNDIKIKINMKKYLIRFLKCLLVIICAPIWYIAAFICALFMGTVGSLILFNLFYEKTGNPDVSLDKTNNIINVICNFMFIESSDKIKEFLNN